MDKSTRNPRSRKAASRPDKPYRDFPLVAHPAGYWAKKIRGKLHYFGRRGKVVGGCVQRLPGDGWETALELYKKQADGLHAGRTPRTNTDALTVRDLCNRFLTHKQHLFDAEDISSRTYEDCHRISRRLVEHFGKTRA